MYQTIRISMSALLMLFVAGCASTTIYPEGKDTYSLVSTSQDQGYAEKDAKEKAEKYCMEHGKSLVVVSHQSAYHGVSKDNAALIGLASSMLTHGDPANPAHSNSDYEVTMKFKCN